MSDDTGRAVGAPGGNTFMIAGKECVPRPLTLVELTELERDCLKRYKREYLTTFTENADLLPEGEGAALVRQKMDEMARWDVSDLPPKFAYDYTKINVTANMKKWLKDNIGFEDKDSGGMKYSKKELETRLQILTVSCLDTGALVDKDCEILTEKTLRKVKIGYANWWITGCLDGMISAVWVCFRNKDITREDVLKEMGENSDMLANVVYEIESLSVPDVGNG